MTEKGGLGGQVAVVSGGSGAIGRAIIACLLYTSDAADE